MAIPTDGTGVQVGLLPDPFAHQLAYFTQMSRFDFSDANIDPRALLNDPNGNDADSDLGVNVILLNSVTRPLRLVDAQSEQVDPGNGLSLGDCDVQICYPTGQVAGETRDHEIPAAQPYPIAAKHPGAGGAPALLAGVGFYRFDPMDDVDASSRVLSFSLGDSQTPLVGVHIRVTCQSRGIFRHKGSFASVAVTADVEKDYGSLDAFRSGTLTDPFNNPVSKPTYATSANDRGALTVWCAPFPHDLDRLGTNSAVVWVRDVSSTTG